MEVLKKNAKSIAISAGVAALAIAGFYSIYKWRKSKDTVPQTFQALNEKEKDSILQQLRVTYDGQRLSADTALAITLAADKLSAVVCANLTNENIKARRAIKDNLIKYARLCKDNFEDVQKAADQAAQEIFNHLGISEDLWYRSFQFYLQQGHPKFANIDLLMSQAEEKIIPKKPVKEISKEDVLNMMVKMTEAYKAEFVNIPLLNAEFKDPNLTSMVVINRATDVVYEQLKIEAQDFNSSAKIYVPHLRAEEKKISDEFEKMLQLTSIAPYQSMQAPQGNRFY